MPEQLAFDFTDGPDKAARWDSFPQPCRDRVVTLFTHLAAKAARGVPNDDSDTNARPERRDEEEAQ